MSTRDRIKAFQAAMDHLANGGTRRSYLVAVYPDGRTFEVYKKDGAWWWDHGKGSYPLSAARENVAQAGGRIERRWRS